MSSAGRWPRGPTLRLRTAPALEPDRAVFPVVRHQRSAGEREHHHRPRGARRPRSLSGFRGEAGASDRSDKCARRAVVTALAEYPEAPAHRVVLNDLPERLSARITHTAPLLQAV